MENGKLSIIHSPLPIPPMHYLIDGHNLIGKMPDIQLSDPNDEVKLVLRIQEWLNGRSSQQATIIFDGRRMMGGVSNQLSSRQLTTIFSPDGIIADDRSRTIATVTSSGTNSPLFI